MDEIDPLARPRRRTFTAAEKLAYLDAYDELPRMTGSEPDTHAGEQTRPHVDCDGAELGDLDVGLVTQELDRGRVSVSACRWPHGIGAIDVAEGSRKWVVAIWPRD